MAPKHQYPPTTNKGGTLETHTTRVRAGTAKGRPPQRSCVEVNGGRAYLSGYGTVSVDVIGDNTFERKTQPWPKLHEFAFLQRMQWTRPCAT